MSKNEYYMIQGDDYKQMAVQVLKAAGLAADIADRSKRIGIKPNILAAKKASDGAVTHPELVDDLFKRRRIFKLSRTRRLLGRRFNVSGSTGVRYLRYMQKTSGSVYRSAKGCVSYGGCGRYADLSLRGSVSAGLFDKPSGTERALPDDSDMCTEKQQRADPKF